MNDFGTFLACTGAMDFGLIGAGLVAGLVGAPHCVGMCGGFATAAATRPWEGAAWHLGKLATYATLGALAGSLGGAGLGLGWPMGLVSALLLVWFAARLAGVTPAFSYRLPWLERLGARLYRAGGLLGRLAFGAVSGLLPCGLVYAALSLAVGAGSPVAGALVMAAFGLGTVPALALAAGALRRLTGARPWVRRGVALGVLVAGLASLAMRWPKSTPEPQACPLHPGMVLAQ